MPADEALLIERCRSVHTVGMRFALDLLWLDATGHVIRIDEAVKPRRMRTCVRARAVIETNAGCGERFKKQLAAVQLLTLAGRGWQGRRERGVR